MKKWIFIILMLINLHIANSTILYVKYDATGGGNGSSWANAYLTLQEALDAASSGYEIWVARGTYKPTYDYGLGVTTRNNHFRLIDGVAIFGGFAGTETLTSQRTNYGEGEVNETILSGDLNSNGRDLNDAYHIIYHPTNYTLTATAILDGFTLTLGYADGATTFQGGAIYNEDNNGVMTIRNCLFINNSADFGAAIDNTTNSSPILINCIVKENIGVVLVSRWSSHLSMYNCQIYDNTGTSLSYYQNCNPIITNCIFYNNTSLNNGGAIVLSAGCSGSFTNVTITNNVGPWGGGGIAIAGLSSPVFNNCIIFGNSGGNGRDIFMDNVSSTVTMNYCVWDNTANGVFLGASDAIITTNNNITSDPLFIDEANDDYRLSKSSPCIDAGNNSYNSETYDIRGDYPRKLNKNSQSSGTIDIGAYEFRAGYDALVISTNNASNIETDVAISGAALFADLFTPITAKGIVWDTLSTPTISLSTKTNEGTTNSLFTSSLSGLKSNTTYYVRAYVTNGSGTTYGDEISFTTLPYGIDEDGNQDGIIDTAQVHVYNYYDENSGNYITIESLEEDTIYDVSKLTAYEDKYHYPLGLMSFKVKASFATIKIYYHGISSLQNYTYRKQKLDGTFYEYTRATFIIQTINGNPTAVVTLRLQDGKTGDFDGTVNGIIYDPGGPAISTVAIPTLTDWAKFSLISSIIIFGVWRRRKKFLS